MNKLYVENVVSKGRIGLRMMEMKSILYKLCWYVPFIWVYLAPATMHHNEMFHTAFVDTMMCLVLIYFLPRCNKLWKNDISAEDI